ncbi:maturation protein [ssRNA phage SRR7976299_4]|uniref:Maturation protein n=1 Tax=ssRNA phage SRR7976299_4 TaxID=2786644 RepID=A0A8S5L508_9VIRU|nr:maturation protein [ssRNA phage SRR7976299_4]DAD52635.1 TPA_asm: maturation protein [ssRNA phage SRR7976299_4]
MITLSGVSGKGTLFGTFYLADRESSGKGYCTYSHLDYAIPPSDWYLPPPDSVWYSTTSSPYGPHLSKLLVGDIQSVDKNSNEWNPCKHSTMRGDALYLGPDGASAPFWRKLATDPKTSFTAASSNSHPPSLLPSFLSAMTGRPCTTADKYVHAYRGDLVKQSLSSSYGGDRYYYADTTLCANIAPPALRTTFLQSGVLHRSGQWYAREIHGSLATSPDHDIHWYKTNWERPDRTTFVRDQLIEYHSHDSYSHGSSTAWTGYGYVVEANHRITTCIITHVRSDSPGRFQVKYDQTTELDWFGWIPWDSYKGSKKVTTTGLTASILILEPGLTPEASVSVAEANSYCLQAKDRARLLYDAKDACSARTAAVCDVQELDSNWIENLAGVKGTMDCIKPLIDGYKAAKTGDLRKAREALAGGYLVYKYAIAPGIADTKNLKADGSRILSLATVNRFSNERRRGASSREDIAVCETKATLSYFVTYHLRLRDQYFSQIWAALEKLGLEPTAGQLWDLIPFSFVADWFQPMGDSLRNIDAYNSLVLNRDLRCRIESFKVQWPVEEQVISDLFDGNVCSNGKPIEYSWYDRRIHHTVGLIDPIAISDGNGLTTSQMAQGTALLSQMKR